MSPRLLGDTLSIALRHRGLEVSVCPTPDRRAEPRPPRHFDVAVVSADLPADAVADVVIVLPEDAHGRAVVVNGDHEPRRVNGLDDVLDLVECSLHGFRSGA